MEYLLLLRLAKIPLSTIWWLTSSTYSWTYWLVYGTPETAEAKMSKRLIELEEENLRNQQLTVETQKAMHEEIKLLKDSLTLLREQLTIASKQKPLIDNT